MLREAVFSRGRETPSLYFEKLSQTGWLLK